VPANDLGAAGAEAIAGVLPDCTFPELDLSRCKLGDAGVTAIAAVLPSCPQICRLILEDNQLGAVAGARLADMLPACPHIRELNIQCTLLPAWLRRTDGGSSPQSFRALAGNHLGPAGAASLAGCLGRQCKLKTLMMARTSRVSHDVSPQQRALPRGLCEGNNIGDDGAIALSKVLPKNRSLKDVDLAGTGGHSCCCYRSPL